MDKIVALGSREFVRQLELGGTFGKVVDATTVSAALEAALADHAAGLVLLEATLVEGLPEELYEKAFFSHRPEVVALGGRWNEVLRRHIRRVVGADLLAPRA